MAERLCGLYFEYLKKQPGIKTFELSKPYLKIQHRIALKPVYEKEIQLLSANDKFSPYLDIMIRSIVKSKSDKNNYDIIILYNDISQRGKFD